MTADLSTFTLDDLRHLLRKQQSTGVHTSSPAICGHGGARGGGYCAACIQAEIDARQAMLGDGDT